MSTRKETGRLGENLAAAYFEQHGFTVLHRNWRHKNWEVDLIATRNGMLHFIEVKTATTLLFGHPEEKVNAKKISYLINASEAFLFQQPQWKRIQFDVLSITLLPGKDAEYFLIEDVYE